MLSSSYPYEGYWDDWLYFEPNAFYYGQAK